MICRGPFTDSGLMSFSFQPPENLKICLQQAPKLPQFKGKLLGLGDRKLTFTRNAKCHGCHETFPSHDECIKHITESSQCQVEIKHVGQTFCFVCERSYETVSNFTSFQLSCQNQEKQAETHYRNSIYNGHQLHRFHHRQYFNFVRQRKSPGRPPRSAESFAPRKVGLMENSLLNFSLSQGATKSFEFRPSFLCLLTNRCHPKNSSFDLTNGLPGVKPDFTDKDVKTEKEDDQSVIEIVDIQPGHSSPTQEMASQEMVLLSHTLNKFLFLRL